VGLWLLASGRWPHWLHRRPVAPPVDAGWRRIALPLRSAGAGMAWIAWPCALSQSALLVAALADTPAAGAAAMAAFAVASAPALVAGPWLWTQLRRLTAGAALDAQATWPLRAAGALLAAGSAWALTHGLAARALAWCFGG
jgi:uncharacterized protein